MNTVTHMSTVNPESQDDNEKNLTAWLIHTEENTIP